MSKKDFYLLSLILLLIFFAYQISLFESKIVNAVEEYFESEENQNEEKTNYLNLFINTALNEEGYREKANNETKYGIWYDMPNAEWCAIFVSWVAEQAKIQKNIIPKFASVKSGMNTFLSWGRFRYQDSYIPKPGDLLFFLDNNSSHVAIVLKTENNKVFTIEGNSLDMVAQRSYDLNDSSITGYGLPDYENN